jgi:hypothetical protein
MIKNKILFFALLSVFLIFSFTACKTQEEIFQEIEVPETTITSFEECVALGNPILESYPEQCIADGEVFVRELTSEEKDRLDEQFQKETGDEFDEVFCEDLCGDGICQEIVCMAVGCPCPETPESCPEDCA